MIIINYYSAVDLSNNYNFLFVRANVAKHIIVAVDPQYKIVW